MTVTVVPETGLLDARDRFVVAASHGRIRLPDPERYTTEGEFIRAGDLIASVEADGRRTAISSPCDGWLMNYVVLEGERVEPGTTIAHLRAL